jgi:HSP20 family protein
MVSKHSLFINNFLDLKADVINLNNSSMVVYADLAGVEEKDVDVCISGNYLIIEGLKRKHLHKFFRKYINDECPHGYFKRYIPIPSELNVEGFDYNINNGILSVFVYNKK